MLPQLNRMCQMLQNMRKLRKVVQAEVHGEAENYPLENEEDDDDENDEEDDEEDTEEEEEDKGDPEWDAEVARQQEIGLIKIRVCFTSSR